MTMIASSKPDKLQSLQRRFATRLAIALDSLGYPAQRLDRTRQLAAALSTDIGTVTPLLGGYAMPNYTQLMSLCDLCERAPGFFLDEHLNTNLPADTVLVRPIGPGESIAVRFPSEARIPNDLSAGLVYHVAKVPKGYGLAAGDYLVASAPVDSTSTNVGDLYLFESEEGFDVLECTECNDRHAVFINDRARDVPRVVFHGRPANQSIRILLMRMQFAKDLHAEHGAAPPPADS